MKKIVLMFVASSLLVACNTKTTSEEAKEVSKPTEASADFKVNTTTSQVQWVGSKVVSGSHHGTVAISEGTLHEENGKLVAGNFTIDMGTIDAKDLEASEKKTKLESHLNSADFFNTEAFKTAKFEITNVEELSGDVNNTHTLTGNLTIKDITKSITFPAKVTLEENKINAIAKFEINRNEWNVMYGGSKETNQDVLANMKDNLIKDMIEFDINIEATK